MVEIYEKDHDLLNDKEIKFVEVSIANVVKNHSFINISNKFDEKKKRKLFINNIKISKIIIIKQKRKQNNKTNKYLIVGFNIIETVKNKSYTTKDYINWNLLSNIDKMNLSMNEKLRIIFEPMLIKNDPQVQYALGFINIKGKYVACDIDKTTHYYSLIINHNYSESQFKFRIIYHEYKGYRAKRDSYKEIMKNLPDGTYDYNTGKPIDFSGQKKYQVAFQTTASEDETSEYYLSNDQYDGLVEEFSQITGSKPYLGKFEVPETSFLSDKREQAMKLAKKYNQKSIWSWEIMKEILNPDYNPKQNIVKTSRGNM